MANTKKPRALRKKVKSFSITTRVAEDFEDVCSRNNIIPSHKIEELIETFNKSLF